MTAFDQNDGLMSSHHLTFVMSEFEAKERTTENEISLCLFASKRLLTQRIAIFALETTERAVKFFSGLFGISPEFRTFDQVVLPNSHYCGGGESFGIAFYHQNCLLLEEKVSEDLNILIIS